MKTNRNFGKLHPSPDGYGTAGKSETEIEYGPIPLTVVTHHREEEDVPVYDPETGEPPSFAEDYGGQAGEQKTEHIVREWDTSEVKIRPTEKDYRQMGFKSVSEAAPSDPAPEGYHYEARGYAEDENRIWRVYEAVTNPPAPPRVFSKIDLEAAVFKRGLLAKLDTFVDAQTITNELGDTMPLRRAYNTAQTFREDHPLFAPYLEAAKQALGVDDATAKAILSECAIGY